VVSEVRTAVFVPGLLFCVANLQAQTMRPFSTFRQLHGETRLTAHLEYGAGTLRLQPGEPDELYRMNLSYDEDRFLPISDFDASSTAVLLGLKARGEGGVRVVSQKQLRQTAIVSVSPRVDLDIRLSLGAVDADLDFGGLRVSELDLTTGASQATVRFAKVNPLRCQRASFSAGAADIAVLGLGNSRCETISFEGGVGKVVLDFGGAASSSAKVQVKMTVGGITLRLPRGAGVRIKMDKFLSSFDAAGLVRSGNGFVSTNYEAASRRLDFDLTSAVGEVKVEWLQ
jgi:hypothetical protein